MPYAFRRNHIGLPYQWTADLPLQVAYYGSAVAAAGISSYLGKRKRDMPRTDLIRDSAMSEATGYGQERNIENVNYDAAIRSSRSRYGKKRRRNLRNAWYELNRSTAKIWSRFQSFSDNGFPGHIGPFPCVKSDTLTKTYYPMFVFRLSSLPSALFTNGNNNVSLRTPLVAYQLYSNPNGFTNRRYEWERIDNSYHTNKGSTVSENAYTVVNSTRPSTATTSNVFTNRFRHTYSDIALTLYPQQQLPTDYTVRLVKFNEEQTCFPPGEGYVGQTVTISQDYVQPSFPVGTEQVENTTQQWDRYWAGKLLHPHNRDTCMGSSAYGKLPFIPLRTEKFYLPSLEQTTGADTRLLHKFFFRNEREYNSKIVNTIVGDNDATTDSYNFYRNKNAEPTDASPYCTPGDEVWLMIDAVSFKRADVHPVAVGSSYPSFDIVIRNCHTYDEESNSRQVVQPTATPANPTLATIIDPEKELVNDVENLINETTEV